MNEERPSAEQVKIGRLTRKLHKLWVQRNNYKAELEKYKEILNHPHIERSHTRLTEWKAELNRVRALETRVVEQEELIKFLRGRT